MKALRELFVYEKSTAYAMNDWCDSACNLVAGHFESNQALWKSWQSWAKTQDHYPPTQTRLGVFLRFQGLRSAVLRSGTIRGWRGISLRLEDAQ